MSDTKSLDPKTGKQMKVIFGDYSTVKFDALLKLLQKEKVHAEAASTPDGFLKRITEEHFDVCVINLLLGGIGPFQLIASVKKASKNEDIRIIVVSKQVHKVNIQNTIRAGADDFVAEPFDPENLFHRVLYHLTPKTVIDDVDVEISNSEYTRQPFVRLVFQAAELLSRTERANIHGSFLQILQKVAGLLASNRTSLIIVDKKSASGMVLASSDDPNFFDFPITLAQYPEIMHVVNAGNIVIVEDVSRNWLTYKIKEKVRTIQIGSIMVFPIHFQGDIVGVLTIRRPEVTEAPSREVLAAVQALANIMAPHSNLKILLRKIYSDFAQNG